MCNSSLGLNFKILKYPVNLLKHPRTPQWTHCEAQIQCNKHDDRRNTRILKALGEPALILGAREGGLEDVLSKVSVWCSVFKVQMGLWMGQVFHEQECMWSWGGKGLVWQEWQAQRWEVSEWWDRRLQGRHNPVYPRPFNCAELYKPHLLLKVGFAVVYKVKWQWHDQMWALASFPWLQTENRFGAAKLKAA